MASYRLGEHNDRVHPSFFGVGMVSIHIRFGAPARREPRPLSVTVLATEEAPEIDEGPPRWSRSGWDSSTSESLPLDPTDLEETDEAPHRQELAGRPRLDAACFPGSETVRPGCLVKARGCDL